MDMLDARFGAYLIVATLLIVTPGPDTALVIKHALGSGWRASSMTALGIALGSLAWGLAAVLGLAVLLEKSVTAFTIFKLAGAAYLLYLGVAPSRARCGALMKLRLANSACHSIAWLMWSP